MDRLRDTLSEFPRPFWVLVLGTFVNRTGLVVVPFLALYLTSERGFTIQAATVAVSLYGAGAFAGGFVGGWLSDRVGRRPVLLASLAGAAVPVAALAVATSTAGLLALAFSFGVLAEMYRPAVSASVADLVAEADRPRAYALIYWAINLGSAVGPALGGWLAVRSYASLFWLEGATLLTYAALVAVAVPETQPGAPVGGRPQVSLRPVVRDGVLAALSLVVLTVGIGFFQLFTTLPLAMAADGLSELDFGLVVSVNGGLIVLVGLPVAAWMGRHQTGWPLPAAVALIAAGLALQAPASTLGAYATCAVVWSVGEMAFLPIIPTLVSRLAPDGLQGSYQGVYHGAWGLSKAIGPALGGLVLAGVGGPGLWLSAAALVAAASAGLAALLPTLRARVDRQEAT